jgi:hypothetical protein
LGDRDLWLPWHDLSHRLDPEISLSQNSASILGNVSLLPIEEIEIKPDKLTKHPHVRNGK